MIRQPLAKNPNQNIGDEVTAKKYDPSYSFIKKE
jgi:hypothetical protein